MSVHYLYGREEDWDMTDKGQHTIYSMDPDLVPARDSARVIYELRLDVNRLNAEVMASEAKHYMQP